MSFEATQMDLDVIILSEVSQRKKDKYIMLLRCGILKKKLQMNLYTKQKQTQRHRKQMLGYQSSREKGIN